MNDDDRSCLIAWLAAGAVLLGIFLGWLFGKLPH